MTRAAFQNRFCLISLAVAVACGLSSHSFAQCEQFGWSSIGQLVPGPGGQLFSGVRSMVVFDDGSGPALYVGGGFTQVGGVTASNIAKWDGTQWSNLGSGVNNTVRALAVFDDGSGPALYVGGEFSMAGGAPAHRLAKWSNDSWSALPTQLVGINASVYALCAFDDGQGPSLFVGGFFFQAGTVTANSIARWDGLTWSALDSGVTVGQYVRAMAGFEGSLHVAGTFTSAGGVAASGIARWNGSTWSALGTGLTGAGGDAMALAVVDRGTTIEHGLYVAGEFTHAGGLVSSDIARWDGGAWHALPYLSGDTEVAYALAVQQFGSEQTLYVGGDFDQSGLGWTRCVGRLDAAGWQSLSRGAFGTASALATMTEPSGETYLYVGGLITSAGGHPVVNIARWNAHMPMLDCNHNGTPDECELQRSQSPDCNENLQPDPCEADWTYTQEGAYAESIWGLNNGGDYLWLKQFNVQVGGESITHLGMATGFNVPDFLPVQLLIYDDPNNDGNPNDAQLLTSVPTANFCNDEGHGDEFMRVAVTPTFVGNVGESFFVGALATLPPAGYIAVATDGSDTEMRNWHRVGSAGTIDPSAPSAGGSITSLNRFWRLRAISMDCNGNGVWNQCDIDSGTSSDENENGLPDECEPAGCPADVAGNDSQVNVNDLLLVINTWGSCPVPPLPCLADINHDAQVSVNDLLLVINNWGPCP